MTASLVQGSSTVSIAYDSEHNRVSQTNPSGTTLYLNDPISGAMSEKFTSGSTVVWHDFLKVDGAIVAERFATVGGSTLMRYFVLDHLGSIAAITDDSGAVVESNSYDAWGKRRNANGTDDTACSLTSQTTRGFTGHEHLDSLCLINENARVYDPVIGRFLSADDQGTKMRASQSWNRYSYVGNRPLSYTDPTGNTMTTICSGQDSSGPTGCYTVDIPTFKVTGYRCGEECQLEKDREQAIQFGIDSTIFLHTPSLGDSSIGGGGGGGGGGGNPASPSKKSGTPAPAQRQPNHIDCNTTLPDGSTVGSHVDSIADDINSRAQSAPISDPFNPSSDPPMDPVADIEEVYDGTNFRKMYAGSGAKMAVLGDAGNFAYGAVSAKLGIPLGATEEVAGAYATLTHPPSDQTGPHGMDRSATEQVAPGYYSGC